MRRAALALCAVLLLSGCTSGGDAERPAADGTAGATAAAEPTAGPSAEPSAVPGTDPADLSEQVLTDAVASAGRPAIATQTVDSDGEQLTLDVVEVRRTDDAVLAELRLSSAAPDVSVGNSRFEEDRTGAVHFVTGVFLEDRAAGIRYRPLSFDDERRGVGCVCPVKPLKLGPQPQTVYALFPPLPDGVDTVTLVLHDAFEVADVPVTG